MGKNPDLIHPGLHLDIPDISVTNCAKSIVGVLSYFFFWANVADWIWWLYTRPTEKEIVERAARESIIGITLAKWRLICRELAGICTKKLELVVSICEFIYDTLKK